jgi:hypothetical protein
MSRLLWSRLMFSFTFYYHVLSISQIPFDSILVSDFKHILGQCYHSRIVIRNSLAQSDRTKRSLLFLNCRFKGMSLKITFY